MNTTLTDSGAPPRGAVVITGASTGIGWACALSLDALGFRVFAGVRKSSDGESLLRASSARLTPVFLDVTDEHSIATAAEKVSQEVGDFRSTKLPAMRLRARLSEEPSEVEGR
ncbi:MAG TPA: SDR family NAD(P)-dependent oxidoreductase [Rubrobacteraceae bacterium]|nr:SDR family NAD(P)-dependent oxidoreductase [Rubrobacteraceae bacterium]